MKQITNRESSAVDKYLNDISKFDLLTVEEEVELAKRIKKGEKKALEQMVKANLRFVVSVAKQYQNQGLSLPDLINEGNLGLIKAAQRFDETKGFKFISYAVWWIRQTILQSLAEQSRIVRLPQNKIGSLNKINKTLAKLEQEFEREPSIQELSTNLKMSPEQVKDFIMNANKPISMDAPISEDGDRSIEEVMENTDIPSPDNELVNESLRKEIERALARLNEREAEVIKMFFGLKNRPPYTLEEIAKTLDLTRERVRQIKDKAIRNLKYNAGDNKILKTYLG
jgi:RNA polymerase primary sigma factor